MMKRSLLISTIFASAGVAAACGTEAGGTATTSGESGFMDTAVDGGTSAEETTSTDGTTADTTATTTEASGEEETGTTDGSCTSDEECPEFEFCNPETLMCEIDCGTANVMLEAPPPPVMLVLDKSGSMVSNSWDHDGDPGTPVETRWKTLYNVTEFITTSFENGINFGVQLFPSTAATATYNAQACDVASTPEVGPATMNAANILGGIPGPNNDSQIKGGTPAADGMRAALSALAPFVGLEGKPPPAVILVTDGAANCNASSTCGGLGNCPLLEDYDNDLQTVVGDAFTTDGITTYVVGIDIINELVGSADGDGTPAANPHDELNEVATLGGAPNTGGGAAYFNATNQAELEAALNEIVGQVATCEIDLNEPPNEPPMEDQINGTEFWMGEPEALVPFLDGPTVEECKSGAVNGWIWVTEGEVVLFCGSYCDDLKSTGKVRGVYPCVIPG